MNEIIRLIEDYCGIYGEIWCPYEILLSWPHAKMAKICSLAFDFVAGNVLMADFLWSFRVSELFWAIFGNELMKISRIFIILI